MSDRHPTTEQLDAYLLDELDPGARRKVAAHLADCASCRDEVARLEFALAAYRDTEAPAVDEAALDRLRTAARSRRRERPRWVSAALAAAAASVIFLGGFWTGRETVAPLQPAPATIPELSRYQPDRDPPAVTFATADADLLQGLAVRDTTWN